MELEIRGISKCYGKQWVLKDINFTIQEGVTALLGNNGAGKTTLIHIIVDLIGSDSGTVTFLGMDNRKDGRRFRNKLGYLPQECGFYSNYTALQFLRYMCTMKDLNTRFALQSIERYMKYLGLWEVRNKKIRQYSGGMKHRLGIVQALLGEPDLLILDEPTTGLDFHERNVFKSLITDYAKEHIVILSTHILSDVEDLANHLLVLNEGRLAGNEDLEPGISLRERYVSMISGERTNETV